MRKLSMMSYVVIIISLLSLTFVIIGFIGKEINYSFNSEITMKISNLFSKIIQFITTNKIIFVILFIVIIALIILILLILKFRQSNNSQRIFIESPVDLQKYNKTIRYDDVPISKNKIQLTYSIWVYFDNIPENAHRVHGSNKFYSIFSKRTTDYINGSPGLYYRPRDSKLMITVKTNKMNKYILKSINLQLWNNIVIVLEDRNCDVYINGKMYRSFFLDNVCDIGTSDLYISKEKSSLYGKLSYFRYFNFALMPEQIEALYNDTNKKNPVSKSLWWLTSPSE